MALAQFPSNIKLVSTEKTFFRKYSYKICFEIEPFAVDGSVLNKFRSHAYWMKRADYRRRLRKTVISLLPEGLDFRTREEGEGVSLFLDDDEAARNITLALPERVIAVHMPLNDEHKRLMHDNHRIRIRRTLYHNKYRYKLNIKNNWVDKFTNFDDLMVWLHSLQVDAGEDRWMANSPLSAVFKTSIEDRTKPRFRYRHSNYAVFLNDEQDVMMLQLWLNEWYDCTEKAVLTSEI